MSGVGRHVAWWRAQALVALGGLVLAAGCGQSSLGASCRSNDDCSAAERCEAASRAEQSLYACTYQSCETTSGCFTKGYICAEPSRVAPAPSTSCFGMICVPPCDPSDPATCPADMLCRGDGSCSYLQCDEPGGLACPEHWRCDPAAAPSEPPGYTATTTSLRGTTLVDPPDPASLVSHGCVRKRCTEDDGYTCDATHVCDESQLANGSGCVPGDCQEIGRCSNDELYICEPTSTAPRSTGTDENGCVARNCEEGRACTLEPDPWHFCDPYDPSADPIGCAVVPCTEGSPCPLQWVCNPSGTAPDRQGCVYHPDRSGAGGTGGDSGSSGSSSGGAGASNGGSTAATGAGAEGGTSGASTSDDPSGEGRCVAR